MNELIVIIVSLVIGALAGTLRTWQTHGLRLIAPKWTFKDMVFKVRLGWIASALIGAGIAWASVTGVIVATLDQPPDTLVEIASVAALAGYGSMYVLNRLIGEQIQDIDAHEFAIELSETNLQKAMLIGTALRELKCVERIQIRDNEYGGVVTVYVVPKPQPPGSGEDLNVYREDCRKKVENFMAKHRPVGVQMYVKLAFEVVISIEMTAELIIMPDDNSPEWYSAEIRSRIMAYLNNLQPGEWVKKNKMISIAMEGFTYIKDIPGYSIKTEPPFEDQTAIKIEKGQTARAGNIAVFIVEIQPST